MEKEIRTSAIVAIGKNRELGKKSDLVWKFDADFARMKELTKNHPLIMGRKTYESIGRELPNSPSIVITSDTQYTPPYENTKHTYVVHSLEDAFIKAKKIEINNSNPEKEIFIFGGSSVYKEALPATDRLYITEIDAEDKDADTFFPEYDTFTKILEESVCREQDIQFRLLTLERD